MRIRLAKFLKSLVNCHRILFLFDLFTVIYFKPREVNLICASVSGRKRLSPFGENDIRSQSVSASWPSKLL